MLDADKKYYLEDVIEITRISERNIKFWVAEYRLNVFKEGRKNLYPSRTITLLNLIKELTESKLFTTKFILIQVERCKNPNKTTIKGLSELNEVTKKMLQYIFEMGETDQIERMAEEARSSALDKPSETELKNYEEHVEVAPEIEELVMIDDLARSAEDEVFQPIESPRNEAIRKVLKELKSPIITLANEPRDKRTTFWQQIKKILK